MRYVSVVAAFLLVMMAEASRLVVVWEERKLEKRRRELRGILNMRKRKEIQFRLSSCQEKKYVGKGGNRVECKSQM